MREKTMLENVKNTNPFTVPEGYFEQLHSQLETKIKQENEKKRSAVRISFFQKAKPYFMAAAIFGVLFSVLQIANLNFDTNQQESITSVSENANIYEFESEQLYSQLMKDEYFFLEYIGNE